MVIAIDELDAPTLSRVLRESALTLGATVTTVERRPVGAGQVASCWELVLGLDDRDHTVSIVAKGPSEDPLSLATANAQHLYRREVRFYEQVAATVRIRTPDCHHVAYDEVTGKFLLLLESMTPAAVADQLEGLSEARSRHAVSELAGLHAPHWAAPSLRSMSFVEDASASLRPLYLEVVPVLFDAFLERYGDALSAGARGVVEWLGPRLGRYMEGRAGPQTVIHGDFRTDNLLFEGQGGVVPMATVDWQTIGHGCAALDVAYLLTTSLTTEARRRDEHALLEVYLDRLRSLGVSGYGMADLQSDYVWHAFQGVVMLVCASMIVARTDRGDRMFLTMIERSAAAVDDLGSRRALEA